MPFAEKSLPDQGFFGETVSGIPKGSTGNRIRPFSAEVGAGVAEESATTQRLGADRLGAPARFNQIGGGCQYFPEQHKAPNQNFYLCF
ncbi:MAG: hypothetical protein HC829_02715 [Bacteroidales bacterium]|nr:hypothetical protein [Bacteroidales bacterium]